MIICVISSLYINLKPSYKIKVETIRDISLFDSDKEYFVYFGRPSCPNCIKFQRYVDTGDFIVVINADKLKLSAEKDTKKTYYRHTGYPGGIYETTFREMQDKHPGRALEIAVKGMLPKGPLGYAMIKKLKIYAGAEHPHSAQQPKVLDL